MVETNIPLRFPAPPPLPAIGRIVAELGKLAFLHHRSAVISSRVTALATWNAVMAKPLPGLAQAFRIRDKISAWFGVTRIGGFAGKKVTELSVGDRLDFFLVEAISDTCLVLSVRDTHLDVMTCVIAEPEAMGTKITIISSVITHNLFGRVYMIPVGPAHRLIVALMLWRMRRT